MKNPNPFALSISVSIIVFCALFSSHARADFLDKQDYCVRPELEKCLGENAYRLIVDIPGDFLAAALFPFNRERLPRTMMDFVVTFAAMPLDKMVSPTIWRISDWSGEAGMRPETVQDWYIPGFLFFDSIMSYSLPVLHATAAFRHDERLYRATYLGMKVWAYSVLAPIPFRYLVQRSYPYNADGELNSPFEFHSSDSVDRNQSVLPEAGSFPSFRAAMWFGLADVFAHEYGYSWAWYSMAGSLTLLADHRHWTTDLVFGALTGFSVSNSVRTRYGQDSHGKFYDFMPFIGKDFIGVTANFQFK